MYQLLKKYRTYLTAQQYKTLKGQIKSGDEYGAIKGLNKILFSKDLTLSITRAFSFLPVRALKIIQKPQKNSLNFIYFANLQITHFVVE